MRVIIRVIVLAGLALAASTAAASCHTSRDRGTVDTQKAAAKVWYLYDCGGNMTALIGDKTVVIPGHGVVSDKAGLIRFRDMMAAVRDNVQKLIDRGKTLEQIQAAHPAAAYDAKWDGHGIGPHRFVAEMYYSLQPHFVGS